MKIYLFLIIVESERFIQKKREEESKRVEENVDLNFCEKKTYKYISVSSLLVQYL